MEQMPPYSQVQTQGYPPQPPRKSRWWIVIVAIMALFLFMFLFFIIGILTLVKGPFAEKPIEVKPESVIELRIRGTLEEHIRTAPLALLGGETQSATFFDLLNGIQRAKNDNRIRGLYYRSGDLSCGMAKATEIRDALLDFRKSGKFFHAYIDFGAELDYYFASAADSIFMPTEGMLEFNGFAIQDIFWKETLDKVGVQFYVEQFEEFKAAGESYSRTGFSAPARQSLGDLLRQRHETFLNAISAGRNLEPGLAGAALSRGIYSADSLLAQGFIDGVRSEGDVRDHFRLRKAAGDSSGKKGPPHHHGELCAKRGQEQPGSRAGKANRCDLRLGDNPDRRDRIRAPIRPGGHRLALVRALCPPGARRQACQGDHSAHRQPRRLGHGLG